MILNNQVYLNIAPYKFTKETRVLPLPEDGYVQVQYLYCGICGGDYSLYLGRRKNYPATRGHEFIAKITNVGNDVQDFEVGDLVVSDFNFRCGQCEYCISGHSHLCVMNGIQKFSNRAFAQYANIHYSYLLKVNDIEVLPSACFIEPLSCVLHAIDMVQLTPNAKILINGGGSIGTLFCLYLCRVKHFDNVYVRETNQSRLSNLLKCYNVHDGMKANALKYDYVFECSNSIDGVQEALNIVHEGGNICVMTHLYGLDTSFIYETLCKKELTPVFPLRDGEKGNLSRAYSIIKDYWLASDNILFEVYNDVEDAFRNKASSNHNKQIIKINHAVD